MKSSIRYQQMDSLSPSKLFQQILLMQGVFYFIGTILISFTYIMSGQPFTFWLVFSWEPIRFDTTMGWTLAMLWLLDTFFSVLALTVIVGRSKLALDFTLTLHFIHLCVAWIVTRRFPTSWLWWLVQVISILLMVSLGTWTSQWRELRVTFFDNEYEMVDQSTQVGDATTEVAETTEAA